MVRFITDPRTAPTPAPKTTLRVIGAGLPRTATSSLQAALETLGYNPCLHMAQIIPHADRQQLLISATHEKDKAKRQKLLHGLTAGYEAVCDMPAIFFLPDLMDMYPDAKVILTTRPDAQTWAESCYTSLGFFFSRTFLAVGFLWKTDRLWYALNMRIVEWVRERFGEGDIFTARFYDLYNESVRDDVKGKGREVLEFRAEDGWGPLCGFLGVGVPAGAFPRVNERKTFQIIKGILVAKGLVSWAVLGSLGWAGWWYISWLMG
ncbi:hypothetical protein N7508_005740 [Penicillium antarcticum]|uniref:uncharacterized protein n=1 Tax=Penicillium antarcticum TaxID=416450 RepID=UPI0023A572B6|nr:uncharacterized protein N7508_005740 [Penicillium antarcticum]KAJ5306725.1 hypothetical protein N7508_005740 [Penicillium antarcticum]